MATSILRLPGAARDHVEQPPGAALPRGNDLALELFTEDPAPDFSDTSPEGRIAVLEWRCALLLEWLGELADEIYFGHRRPAGPPACASGGSQLMPARNDYGLILRPRTLNGKLAPEPTQVALEAIVKTLKAMDGRMARLEASLPAAELLLQEAE